MPYKDPERKRQWEREHREQRNTKRRINMRSPGKESFETMKADQLPGEKSGESVNRTTISNIGCAFILAALLAQWCFRNVLRSSEET